MFRSYSSACLAAAFGAVVILPIHARCLEAQLPLSALAAVGIVAAIAASAWFIIMALWDGLVPSAGGAWRSTLAAFLAAAYGAVAIGSVYDRCLDAMLPAPEWLAVTFTAWSAAIACLLIMLCRSPVEVETVRIVAFGDELPPGMIYHTNKALPPCRLAEAVRTGDFGSFGYQDGLRCRCPGGHDRQPVSVRHDITVEAAMARKLDAEARLADARARQVEWEYAAPRTAA